jgi:hypothetical protein
MRKSTRKVFLALLSIAWIGCMGNDGDALEDAPQEGVSQKVGRLQTGGTQVPWIAPTLLVDSNFPGGVLRFNSATDFINFFRAFDGAEAPATGSVAGTHAYSASNTNSANQNYVTFTIALLAGQNLNIGTCDVEGSSFSGDTYLRVFNGSTQVASNDDACGNSGSRIDFTATITGTYQIRMGCYLSNACSGTVAYVVNDAINAGATTNGAISFSATNTTSATQNYATVSVQLQQGQKIDLGTCGVSGSTFSGDTYLRIYNISGNQVAANDDACGGLGSRIEFTANITGAYQIRMGCYSSGACSGTLAYSVSAPLTQAQMLPQGFTSAHTALQAAPPSDPPGDAIIDVTEAEFLMDLKLYLTEDDAIRKLVDSELQVVVGNTLHHITNLGVFKVDLSQFSAYRSWYNANKTAINTDPNFTSIPGETYLGNGAYQVMPGVTRSTGPDYGAPSAKLLGYDEEGGGQALNSDAFAGEDSDPTRNTPECSSSEGIDGLGAPYGRIAYWWGKVNLHTVNGGWTWDTNCTSGADLDPLAYCRKFWPFTASVTEVPVTQKTGNLWFDAGCQTAYPGNGLREFACNDTLSCNTTPPSIAYNNYPVDGNFRRSENHTFGNKRFVFKAKHTKIPLGLGSYASIGIKGKLQRKKRFLGIGYWGPSNADEIVIGIDNMYLWTDYVYPHPENYNQLAQPKFDGLANFKIGNWLVKAIDVKINVRFMGWRVTPDQVAKWIDEAFNGLVGNVYNNIYEGTVTNIIDSIDPSFSQRYRDYAKRVTELDDQYRVKWVIGRAQKPQCYGHANRWTFDWNIGFNGAEYSYEMKKGSFFGYARVGSSYYGIRFVRL